MRGLLDILFPPACVACGRVLNAEAFFCGSCDPALERIATPRCRRCAEPGAFLDETCPRCASRPPPFEAAFAPFAHEGPVARAIHRFKYEDHPELARSLAALLARESGTFLASSPGDLCALPLHRTRLRKRRYDQAELLAGELARTLDRRRLQLLDRVRATQRQVGLSEAAREANVAGAFEADPSCAGRDLVLVDDVFTTGATARAAASALLGAGARSVRVLTLARAYTL
jgi:ComF family protein